MTRVEQLLLGYLAFLSILVTACGGPAYVHFAALLVATAIATIAWVAKDHRVRDFAPCAYLVACFELTGASGAVNPHHGDVLLATVDHTLWPRLFDDWYAFAGRPTWLVELSSVVYVSFYVVPIFVGVALYRRSVRELRAFVNMVTIAFVVSWMGYLVLPTTGPRVARGEVDAMLGGGVLLRLARGLLSIVELNRWDAFPSAHTMIAVVVAASAWRSLPRARTALVGWAAATTFSTVFLSYHYVSDVVAGALAAAMVVVAVEAAHVGVTRGGYARAAAGR